MSHSNSRFHLLGFKTWLFDLGNDTNTFGHKIGKQKRGTIKQTLDFDLGFHRVCNRYLPAAVGHCPLQGDLGNPSACPPSMQEDHEDLELTQLDILQTPKLKPDVSHQKNKTVYPTKTISFENQICWDTRDHPKITQNQKSQKRNLPEE